MRLGGAKRLEQKLSRKASRMEKAAERTLESVGADLEGKSSRFAPVEIGALRGSSYHEVSSSGGEVSVEVGFKGLEYIIVQHESLSFQHPRGGSAKFLERPWAESKPRYFKAIEATVNEVNQG